MARILIVDDEPLTVEMLSTFLSLSNYEPIGALTVGEMWQILCDVPVDAILLDIMLPDGNGLDVCRQLRSDVRWQTTPILMISAHTPAMIAEAEAAGANGYLMKPARLPELLTLLQAAGV